VTLAFWVPGVIVPGDRAVYVRSADKGALLEVLDQKGSPCPRIVVVQPNGESALPLLQFLQSAADRQAPAWLMSELKNTAAAKVHQNENKPLLEICRRNPKLDQLKAVRFDSVGTEVRPLLQAARDVVVSLSICNAATLIRATEALEAAVRVQSTASFVRYNPLTARLAQFLRDLGERLILPMEQGILYVHHNNDTARRNWWRAQSTLLEVCINLRSDLRTIGAPEIPPVVARMEAWLTAIIAQIKRLALTIGGNHQVVFETASAWFAAAALRHIECAHAGWGILFLHRAVEWLMMAIAADRGLMDFTRAGGRYKSQYLGPNEVMGFRAHMTVLESYISSKGVMDLFEELNAWRNMLPYTHHMTVARDIDAYTMMSKTVDALPGFSGSRSWITALQVFAAVAPLEIEDLLDPDGLLRSSALIVG
jgi:hypothetical protein